MPETKILSRNAPFRWLKAIGLTAAFIASLSLTTAIGAGGSREKPLPNAALKPAALLDDADANPAPQSASEDHAALRAIARDSFYDPANPDLGTLQKLPDVTRHMPFDPNGFPDWMRALKEGSINPRTSLNGKAGMEVLDMDVIMRNTKEMPNVRFPHRSHTLWLACTNCHPKPFNPVAGSNSIRMADIFRGEFCGMCHDRVAFITFFSCSRCHSVPQNTANVAGKP